MVGNLLTSLSTNKDEWELLYGWEKYNRNKLAYLAAAREEGIELGIEKQKLEDEKIINQYASENERLREELEKLRKQFLKK